MLKKIPVEDLSLAMSFVGLLTISIIFLKLLIVLVFVLLTQLSIPAPGPRAVLLADLPWIWTLTIVCTVAWVIRLGLFIIEKKFYGDDDDPHVEKPPSGKHHV
jgi:hypothetical protein